jgi:hypothetical protein
MDPHVKKIDLAGKAYSPYSKIVRRRVPLAIARGVGMIASAYFLRRFKLHLHENRCAGSLCIHLQSNG